MSMEVPSALIIAAFLLTLSMMGGSLNDWCARQMHDGLAFQYRANMSKDALLGFMQARATDALLATMPFLLAALVVSVLSSFITSGWSVSTKVLSINMGRLSPMAGLKELFSPKAGMSLLTSLAKLLAVGVILWIYLQDKLPMLLALTRVELAQMVSTITTLTFGVMLRVALAIGAIAAADLVYQKWKYKRDLRMTVQEVKEERKEHEASPQIKSRMRAIQFEMMRKRMLQEVPKADLVLVNPTHVAVALKYKPGSMQAPVVVAKGPDLLAQKIKEIARANNVPIVHRPELARALFGAAEVGEPVPETLFVAVAEVLAMIYRLRGKSMAR